MAPGSWFWLPLKKVNWLQFPMMFLPAQAPSKKAWLPAPRLLAPALSLLLLNRFTDSGSLYFFYRIQLNLKRPGCLLPGSWELFIRVFTGSCSGSGSLYFFLIPSAPSNNVGSGFPTLVSLIFIYDWSVCKRSNIQFFDIF